MSRLPSRIAASLLVALALMGACSDDPTVPASPGPSVTRSSQTPTEEPSAEPGKSPDPSESPDASADLSFAAIGDFGNGSLEQLSVAARMCSWRKDHPFDLVVTTGDNIYPDGSPEQFEANFFEPYKCLFDAGVEWRASLGNHDWATEEGAPVLDEPAFGMPDENYVVRESGVRFVIANSNAMDRQWLRSALPAEPGDRWTIVVFHHPVFSPGLHGSFPAFADLPEIFEEYGVDLVLNGHDHIYARIEKTGGIRYVVTGGGGSHLYPCLPSPATEVCELEFHFLYVTANDKEIRVTAVPANGKPFDRFATKGLD
ncbi:MAG TPA: metallophosphoesterase [Actinomycetota bacterium]|nr:metallophosphoesterase [Actinomycetota bacterium]